MTRPKALLVTVFLLALAGCAAPATPDGEPFVPDEPSTAESEVVGSEFAGRYALEYGTPSIVTSVGLEGPGSIVEVTDVATYWKIVHGDPPLGNGTGITGEFEIRCVDTCFAASPNPGRPLFEEGVGTWDPDVSPSSDDYYEGCDPALLPPNSVQLRDVVETDGLVQSFTVDLYYFQSFLWAPDAPNCTAAALATLEVTATRIG